MSGFKKLSIVLFVIGFLLILCGLYLNFGSESNKLDYNNIQNILSSSDYIYDEDAAIVVAGATEVYHWYFPNPDVSFDSNYYELATVDYIEFSSSKSANDMFDSFQVNDTSKVRRHLGYKTIQCTVSSDSSIIPENMYFVIEGTKGLLFNGSYMSDSDAIAIIQKLGFEVSEY